MKNTVLIALGLLSFTGASFAGPIDKAPPPRPILPPVPSSSGGWYGGLNGGYLWLNDASGCGCTTLDASSGWGVLGVAGYHFSDGISLGLSSGYMGGKYDILEEGSQAGGTADLHMVPITANASYTFNLSDSLLLYVGGGLGTAWSELNGVGGSENKGDWHFAWKARAGFGYKVSDDVSLNLGYRYIHVADALGEFGDAKGHMAEAGIKFNF